jgi:hypothetical protein
MILLDVLLFVSRNEVERSQLVCKIWHLTIDEWKGQVLCQRYYFDDVFLSNVMINLRLPDIRGISFGQVRQYF